MYFCIVLFNLDWCLFCKHFFIKYTVVLEINLGEHLYIWKVLRLVCNPVQLSISKVCGILETLCC